MIPRYQAVWGWGGGGMLNNLEIWELLYLYFLNKLHIFQCGGKLSGSYIERHDFCTMWKIDLKKKSD